MADLDTLRLSITADAAAASAQLNYLTESLTSLKQAMNGFKASKGLETALGNISTLATGVANAINTLNIDSGFSKSVTDGLTNIVSAVNSVSDESIAKIERLGNALKNLPQGRIPTNMGDADDGGARTTLRDRMASLGDAFSGGLAMAGKGAAATIKGVAGAIGGLNNAFNKSSTGLSKFISGFARIAKYRIVRTIIRGITSGAKEGLQNLAHYSNEANAALSNLSTGTLYLKNSFGAALYPAIASVIGIFNSLINVVVRALNILNMFFSVLGGKGTYIKATKQTKNYASALGGAGGAAKALKQELMGFDEINALSPSSGGGGGGGGGGLDYGSMFEEVPVESWLQDMMDSGDFSGLGAAIADKINNALGKIPWNKVYAGAKKAADSLSSLLNGFIGKIDPAVVGQTIAGVINTAAIFVSNFWDNTNWEQLGTKTKDAIIKAIRGIDVKTLAGAITGKFRAAIRFLKNLLPTSGAEWKEITDKLTELLNNIILGIKPEDIGDMIASVITGGLKLITSIAEAGTLTNIATAVVNAIKEAFASISKQDIKDAWDAVKGDVFSAAGLVAEVAFEALISIAGVLLDTAKDDPMELMDMIGAAFTAAGFVLLATGHGGIALALGISITAIYELINGGFDGFIEDVKSSVSQAFDASLLQAALKTVKSFDAAEALVLVETAQSVDELYTALYTLGQLDLSNVENEFSNAFGATDTAEGFEAARMAVADFIKEYDKITSGDTESTLPMQQQLASLCEQFGLSTVDAEELAASIMGISDTCENADFTLPSPEELGFPSVTESAQDAEEAVTGVSEALSDLTVSTDAEDDMNSISEAADALATDIDNLPQVVILDSTALSDVESGATAAANSVGGLTAFIAMLQRALGTLGSGKMFAPIADSANKAKEAAETLKSSISSIPESRSIKISLGNTTSVNSKLSAIKSKIDGIKSKTISIQVKAGLTSGAKSFLNTLKGVSSGSTATSINNLLKLSQFAGGGFPRSGELFMANENGKQELVGRIGNQPAVANQDQIGDAIFRYMDAHSAQSGGGISTEELATAIVRGIKASGLGVVKLDGKTISGSINRETQRSGKPAIQF